MSEKLWDFPTLDLSAVEVFSESLDHRSVTLDFKQTCTAAGGSSLANNSTSSLSLGPVSPESQSQFNIFPAIFSRQLNFSAANCNQQQKFMIHNSMDDLRPNLVGGLLGLQQQGLIDDHNQIQHNNSESKFMSLQDSQNRYENRLLGLTQDARNSSLSTLAGSSSLNLPNGNDSSKNSIQRKCSSTPEDFNSLYGSADLNAHHHTPAHTPPNRLNDHNSITGENLESFFVNGKEFEGTCWRLKDHFLVNVMDLRWQRNGQNVNEMWKLKN